MKIDIREKEMIVKSDKTFTLTLTKQEAYMLSSLGGSTSPLTLSEYCGSDGLRFPSGTDPRDATENLLNALWAMGADMREDSRA